MRVVVKFGGSSIATPGRVRTAASDLAKLAAEDREIMVVVSAMGGSTDALMQNGRDVWPEATFDQHYLQLLATGELQAASMMAMALSGVGRKAAVVGFGHPGWPLVAAPGQAENQALSEGKVNDPRDVVLDEAESSARFAHLVEPMLSAGLIPVFPGFFIRERDSDLVTLGRGGSDVTAFLVGRFGRADEVVIVSDVEGVMSADPREIAGSKVVPSLDAGLLSAIARSGAQVLHPSALRHKLENTTARVVHYRELGRLAKEATGTTIEGTASTLLTRHPDPLTLILLFARGLCRQVGVLQSVGAFLADRSISVHSMTQSDEIVALYLTETSARDVLNDLHDEFVGEGRYFTEIATSGPIAEITLANTAFVDTPGVISAVSHSLGRAGINIVEMVTSHTRIVVYCDFGEGDRATRALAERLNCPLGDNG